MPEIYLAIVQLDLFESSKHTAKIESLLKTEGTKLFFDKIKKFVDDAFNSVTNNSQYDEVLPFGGDAFRILFKEVDNAYQFVNSFCKIVEEYNSQPNVEKLIFRIGAATGLVNYDSSTSGPDKVTGHYVLVPLARLVTAEPGWFYVDQETFKGLNEDVKQNFIEVLVKGKEHEENIKAWRRQMSYDTSLPVTESIKLEEIYDLFNKLTLQAQIVRVAQLIGMPNDFRPSNYETLYAAKTAIVNWADTDEEYRLERFEKIRNAIKLIIK